MRRKKGSRGRKGPNVMKSGSNSVESSNTKKRQRKNSFIMPDDREINLAIASKMLEEASRGATVDQIWDFIHGSLNSRSPRPWGSRMWSIEDTRCRGIALIKCCKVIMKELIAQRQDEEDDSLVSILLETKNLHYAYKAHVRQNKLRVYHILEDHLNLLDAYIEAEEDALYVRNVEPLKEDTDLGKVAYCVRAGCCTFGWQPTLSSSPRQ